MELINHLKLLSKQFPNIDAVSTEIINLSAILNLPKGTEHFITDIHGEYEAFSHVIRNASGTVKRKINETFQDDLTIEEKEQLASLVYYPKEKLIYLKKQDIVDKQWYQKTIYRLVLLLRKSAFKYTRSKVRKALPDSFRYIIEELVQEQEVLDSKKQYYKEIINTIIRTGRADDFVVELSNVIIRLVVDKLHIIGDIYDRGPGAHLIMHDLMNHHSVDIQWGNHDIIWMGAAAGSRACIANVLRISLRYGNLETVQEGYGINIMPLSRFAEEVYKDDPGECFIPKLKKDHTFKERDIQLLSKMQKAMAIIQFKIEGQIIKNRPDFNMEDRLLLDKISKDRTKIKIGDEFYDLLDSNFPTVDPDDPYKLTEEENEIIENLVVNFTHSEKLQEHIEFLFAKGSLYSIVNNNLLYHGCLPLTEDGEFDTLYINGSSYSGKLLYDYFQDKIREAYFNESKESHSFNMDMVWYAWCGKLSPLFGKDKMATFERYFLKEKELHKEIKNPYYMFRDDVDMCNRVIEEFGLKREKGRIINGHVPVKVNKGENPVKADGKMIVIDGGFSKAYQKVTGIAGYTLTYNSQAMILVSHEPFETHEASIYNNKDMIPHEVYVKKEEKRVLVGDTDVGKDLKASIEILNQLLDAYRKGIIEQK